MKPLLAFTLASLVAGGLSPRLSAESAFGPAFTRAGSTERKERTMYDPKLRLDARFSDRGRNVRSRHKYFAPGVGIIKDDGFELIEIEMPR